MPNESAFRTIVDDAERAAAGGDYVSAEQLLREAAALQEADLGPHHPALANTLNNLAVASELAGKPEEAELSYRRAHAIATKTLAPNDPLVATTEKNLRGFLEARGMVMEPIVVRDPLAAFDQEPTRTPDVPAPEPVIAAAPSPPIEPDVERTTRDLPLGSSVPPAEVVRRDRKAPNLAIVAVLAAALVVLTVAARTWFASDAPPEAPAADSRTPPPAPAESRPAPAAAPVPEPSSAPAATPPAPADAPGAPAPQPVPVEPTPAPSTQAPASPGAPAGEAGRESASAGSPAVVTAQLCLALATRGGWRCEPATSPVRAGVLFFYTRIRSAANVEVQHRWYRDNRLFRVVDLQVGGNSNEGYRTYSRTTVSQHNAGEWRVELATKDGTVLHEEQFTVQ